MQVDKYYIPEELLYDTNDFWISLNKDEAIVGMTDYGQSNTGDILYLELAEKNAQIKIGEKFGSIESGKWVGNLNAPLGGTVIESNAVVESNPRMVNTDAYGQGWLYKIKLNNTDVPKSLMTATQYAEWVKEQIRNEQEIG